MNFQSFEASTKTWQIKWLDAKAGSWTDLLSEEMGGLRLEGESIVYAFKEPVAEHAYTRATYTNISETHFTWRGERSEDGEVWDEFMVVECDRSEG